MHRTLVAVTLLAALWTKPSPASFADLDSAFGTGGIVASGASGAGALFVDSTDRIYTMARSHPNYLFGRYMPDGTLDTTFGNSGFVLVQPWASSVELLTFAYDEGSDTLVVAGYEQNVGAPASTVARYDLDGDIVTTFGPGGAGHIEITDNAFLYAVRILPDGTIVAAGEYLTTGGVSGIERDVAVSRMSSTGALDSGFGSGGTKILALGSHCEAVRALGVDASNRILVGVSLGAECDVASAAIVKLGVDGTPDATFSGDGIAMLGIGGAAVPRVILGRDDGGVVALSGGGSDPYGETARLTVTQLGADGAVAAAVSSELPSAVDNLLGKIGFGIQTGGKVVGSAVALVNSNEELRFYRLTGCAQLTAAGGTCAGADGDSGGGGGGTIDLSILAILLLGLRQRIRR